MKKYQLTVSKRDIFGKQLKKLRKEGLLPANIYGKNIPSIAIQVPFTDFEATFKEAGETGIVELKLDSETKPTLIHDIQRDYATRKIIHADFYQVNLKEKIKTKIPLVLIGEPTAVAEKLGLLLQTLNEVEVEALPGDLPEKIEVDVTHLAAVNDGVTVGELKKPTGVGIVTPETEMVAKISELVAPEPEPVVAETPAEGEAGAVTEGEAKEEGKETTKEETTDAKKEEGK